MKDFIRSKLKFNKDMEKIPAPISLLFLLKKKMDKTLVAFATDMRFFT